MVGSTVTAIPAGAPPHVVVVGGGIAGLGAAYRLAQRGIRVTVFEAAPKAGGRILTEQVEGFHLDIGANLFLEVYGAVREVAAELGVPFRRARAPICGGVYFNGKLHGLPGGNLPARLKATMGLLSLQLLSPRGLWEAFKFLQVLKSRAGDLSFDDHSRLLDLDTGESIGDYFEKNIGTECLDRVMGPLISSFTFGAPDEVGVVYALVAAGNFGIHGAWPYMPERGPGAFMEALAAACRANTRVSTPVERVVIEDGITKGVITRAGFVAADAVICAATATTALRIAPDLPSSIRDVLGRVTYSKCYRVFFGVDSNPLPKGWYAVTFPRSTGARMIGISHSAVLLPDTAPPGKALMDVLMMGGEAEELFAMREEEAGKEILDEVRRFLPAMSPKPLFTRAYRWEEAVCLAPGGAMKALHEMRRHTLPQVKGLFLAGGYMGVPSTNGALRSGLNAAVDCAAHVLREGTSP